MYDFPFVPESDKIILPIYIKNSKTGEDHIYYLDWEAYCADRDFYQYREYLLLKYGLGHNLPFSLEEQDTFENWKKRGKPNN